MEKLRQRIHFLEQNLLTMQEHEKKREQRRKLLGQRYTPSAQPIHDPEKETRYELLKLKEQLEYLVNQKFIKN